MKTASHHRWCDVATEHDETNVTANGPRRIHGGLGQIRAFEQRGARAVKEHDSFTIWPAELSASFAAGTRVKKIGINAARDYSGNPLSPPKLLP